MANAVHELQTGSASRRKWRHRGDRHRCSARSRGFGRHRQTFGPGARTGGRPFRSRTDRPRLNDIGDSMTLVTRKCLECPAENRGRQSVASRPIGRQRFDRDGVLAPHVNALAPETGKSCDFGRRQSSRLLARQPFDHRIWSKLFELYCRASLSWRTVSRCWLPSSA